MKKSTICYILFAIGLSFVCCNKHDKTPKKMNCGITQISDGTNTSDITYNSDGKIATIKFIHANTAPFLYAYSYSKNTITEIVTGANKQFIFKAIFTLNNDGQIINAIEYDNEAKTVWKKKKYAYNGNQLAQTTYSNSQGASDDYKYNWKNGNMISSSLGDKLTYYTDKSIMPGDAFTLSIFMDDEGIANVRALRAVKNKNLLASINNVEYSYTFDTKGRITTIKTTLANKPGATYQITYGCN